MPQFGVPLTRQLTINGTTFDLSADRSWTVSGSMTVAGTGSELQYRSSGTALAALTGSSVSGSNLTLGAVTISHALSGSDVSWLRMSRGGLYGIEYIEKVSGYVALVDKSNNQSLFEFPEGIADARYMCCPAATARMSVGLASTLFGSVNAKLHVRSGAASAPAIIAQGTTSQSAAVLSVQDVNANVVATVSIAGAINASSVNLTTIFYAGVYTFATVPSASANTGGTIRISDRSQRLATSDGTNWNWAGTTTVIT